MPAQFNIRPMDHRDAARLQHELGLPRFIAMTLAARGIVDADEAHAFLRPALDRDWRNPYEIPGIAEVADALEAAIRARKHVIVFGDFDLDGISATTVLTRGLRALGGWATPFIPRRSDEGYGVTEAAYERIKPLKPDLIVTVDCGISGREEIAKIVADGVDVVVTDHHEAGDQVPQGIPVADPKLDERCESAILAGVGVALKLVQILGGRMGYPHLWRSYTDFAALGTVADLMPMRGENRALVAHGLERMNKEPRPCIAALMETSGAAGKPLTATNLSFSLVPRLNAAGRMGDAQIALDLLMCDNFSECHTLAERLEGINDERRLKEAELSEIAKEKAAATYKDQQRALVVAGEGWHEGVKGIVASRLVNIYGVPALLFTIDGDEARGSGRSVGTVNLFAAVESASDLVTRFGGHEAAVGVTLPAANLEAFAERLCAYMDQLPEDDFHPLVDIDACVELDELTIENISMLDMLAPFGQENPVPTYLARNVVLTNCRAVGSDKNHFACTLTNGRSSVSGIMFHCSQIDTLLYTDTVVDAAFSVQVDEWRGRRSVKAMLETVVPARMCGALEACLNPDALSFTTGLFSQSDEDLCREGGRIPAGPESCRAMHDINRERWKTLARRNPELLEDAIVAALIGDKCLHPSQREVLDRLKAGLSTFAIMATGRGKSLIFQTYAVYRALMANEASLFLYPLRALIADQVYHLTAAFEDFGITAVVLTGESTPEERMRVYSGLRNGTVDIVLTTPEYARFHVEEIAASGRIGFMVVDEAHHVGLARAGGRSAYAELDYVIERLNNPVVLAVTATANDDVARDIDQTLRLPESVVDETSRENLYIDDQRNIRNRDDYLANLVAYGEKTVIYVNSREQSVAVARNLRRRVPQLAPLIGFYNAGLTRGERKRVEDLFRCGHLTVLVATSAFGEGIDIPDIRHVVLYHLPFNEIEFNQMSGRAGRDGLPAVVHLLYGRADIALNERLLAESTPDHDVMAQVYRCLRAVQRQVPGEFFCMSNADLAIAASNELHMVTPTEAACSIAVFGELGLIETRVSYDAGRSERWIRVDEGASKVELRDSIRYREGLDERDVFNAFRDWAMRCDSNGLFVRVSRPIVPHAWRNGR